MIPTRPGYSFVEGIQYWKYERNGPFFVFIDRAYEYLGSFGWVELCNNFLEMNQNKSLYMTFISISFVYINKYLYTHEVEFNRHSICHIRILWIRDIFQTNQIKQITSFSYVTFKNIPHFYYIFGRPCQFYMFSIVH